VSSLSSNYDITRSHPFYGIDGLATGVGVKYRPPAQSHPTHKHGGGASCNTLLVPVDHGVSLEGRVNLDYIDGRTA